MFLLERDFRELIWRRSIYTRLGRIRTKSREAAQTTQRTFLSVELQGKLYAILLPGNFRTAILERESKICSVVGQPISSFKNPQGAGHNSFAYSALPRFRKGISESASHGGRKIHRCIFNDIRPSCCGRSKDVPSASSVRTHRPAESLNVAPPPVQFSGTFLSSVLHHNHLFTLFTPSSRAWGEPASQDTGFSRRAKTIDLC